MVWKYQYPIHWNLLSNEKSAGYCKSIAVSLQTVVLKCLSRQVSLHKEASQTLTVNESIIEESVQEMAFIWIFLQGMLLGVVASSNWA